MSLLSSTSISPIDVPLQRLSGLGAVTYHMGNVLASGRRQPTSPASAIVSDEFSSCASDEDIVAPELIVACPPHKLGSHTLPLLPESGDALPALADSEGRYKDAHGFRCSIDASSLTRTPLQNNRAGHSSSIDSCMGRSGQTPHQRSAAPAGLPPAASGGRRQAATAPSAEEAKLAIQMRRSGSLKSLQGPALAAGSPRTGQSSVHCSVDSYVSAKGSMDATEAAAAAGRLSTGSSSSQAQRPSSEPAGPAAKRTSNCSQTSAGASRWGNDLHLCLVHG